MPQLRGLGYVAIIVRDLDESVRFYERLGLRLLYLEPNPDDPESTTAMLSCGTDDTLLRLVGPTHAGSVAIAEASPGVGSMQYLSLAVSLDEMTEMWHEMSRVGVHASEQIQRGYERLVFLEDPNGVLVTLTAWGVEPPEGMPRALVLRGAAQLRDAAGSTYIEDEHIARAIADITAAVREG